mgnify:CR=1 FL=1
MYKKNGKAYIYKLTSPSGKNYIGQAVCIKRRVNSYKALRCKSQPHIYNALKKYGWDNFTFEILATVDKIDEGFRETLNDLEIKYIEEFGGFTKGYNLTTGGGVCVFSEETRLKMSNAKKGKKQTADHIANSTKGRRASRTYEPVSEKTKLKISKTLKQKYASGEITAAKQEFSKERRKQMSETATKTSKRLNIRVASTDRYGNTLIEFNSVTEAAEHYGISREKVCHSARGHYKKQKEISFVYLGKPKETANKQFD